MLMCVISDCGMSECHARRVDESVEVGVSVEVSHAPLSALPDLSHQSGGVVGGLQRYSK